MLVETYYLKPSGTDGDVNQWCIQMTSINKNKKGNFVQFKDVKRLLFVSAGCKHRNLSQKEQAFETNIQNDKQQKIQISVLIEITLFLHSALFGKMHL